MTVVLTVDLIIYTFRARHSDVSLDRDFLSFPLAIRPLRAKRCRTLLRASNSRFSVSRPTFRFFFLLFFSVARLSRYASEVNDNVADYTATSE